MGRKKKKITPSQKRYNQKVPATTFRMDPETRQKLLELYEASKAKTKIIFFKGLVGNYKLQLISIAEARKAGYESGYRDARFRYAVSFPCPDCGQTIFINTPELKAKVRKLIGERLAHSECPSPTLTQPPPPKPTSPNINPPKPNPPVMPVAKSNVNQDKILHFLREQPSPQQMLKSDSNTKNQTGS
jgi:hypothetical protein